MSWHNVLKILFFGNFLKNKTKVLSVQLRKTLSFVKIVVEWGGLGGGRGGLWILLF